MGKRPINKEKWRKTVSISMPKELHAEMQQYPGINWSWFLRTAISQKLKRLRKIK